MDADDDKYPDEDFPTDEQVRLYSEQYFRQLASEQPRASAPDPRLAAEAFMIEFVARNPDIKEMKYLGEGRYEVRF